MAGAGAPPQTAAAGRKLALLLIAAAVPIGRAVCRDDRKTTAQCWSVHGIAEGCSHHYGQAFCAIPGLQCQDWKCLTLGISKGTCECKCGWYATPPTAENGWYWGCKQYDPNQPWDPDPDVMEEQRKTGECPEDSDATPPQKLSKEPTTSVATSQAPSPTTTGNPTPAIDHATLAPTTLAATTTPSPTTTTEEVAITTGEATTTKQASVCCMALQASCLACNQGVMVEEFCKGSPDTPGCETISTTKDLLASVLATGLIKDDAKKPEGAPTSTTVFDEAMMPEEAAKEADEVAAAPAEEPAEESESTTTQPATTTAEVSTTASVFWRLYGDRGRALPAARPRSATAATALVAGVAAVTVAMSAVLVLRQHGRIYRHASEADEERVVPSEERVLL